MFTISLGYRPVSGNLWDYLMALVSFNGTGRFVAYFILFYFILSFQEIKRNYFTKLLNKVTKSENPKHKNIYKTNIVISKIK